MGYTTEFSGRFDLDKPLTVAQVVVLRNFADTRHEDEPGTPGIWCQWVPTEDGQGIEWDGNEKFYAYVEWLDYIVKKFLTPWGITLSGEVQYRGEEFGDDGTISR